MSLDRIFTLIDTGQISPSRAGLCKMASENTAKCLLENGFDDVFLLSTGNHRKTGCKTDEGGYMG